MENDFKQECGNCVFFTYEGCLCRRYPPVKRDPNSVNPLHGYQVSPAEYPAVSSSWWCGEYKNYMVFGGTCILAEVNQTTEAE